MIFDLLALLVFNALVIFGIFNSATYRLRSEILVIPEKITLSMIDPDSRQILSGFRIWLENKIGLFYSKPFIGCPQCMASIHSVIPYLLFFWNPQYYFLSLPGGIELFVTFPLEEKYFALYPLYICALSSVIKATKRIFISEHLT